MEVQIDFFFTFVSHIDFIFFNLAILLYWQSHRTLVLQHNENAWAFTYLPRSLIVQSFCPKVPMFVMDWDTHTNHDLILWRHDIILSHHTIGHIDFTWQKPGNHICWPCDLDLWPTTLIYNPSLGKVKVNSHTKNQGHRSNGSSVRAHTHRHIDTQKHGSDSMTSTADAGGNECDQWQTHNNMTSAHINFQLTFWIWIHVRSLKVMYAFAEPHR